MWSHQLSSTAQPMKSARNWKLFCGLFVPKKRDQNVAVEMWKYRFVDSAIFQAEVRCAHVSR